MGGFFGITSKSDCMADVFFGTDYHSHLGTRRGGMAAWDPFIGLQRKIHNIENAPFRTRFEHIIFTYGMQRGLERLAAAGVKNVSLTNFDRIAAVAAREGYIKPEDVERLIAFRNNPSDESWIGGTK